MFLPLITTVIFMFVLDAIWLSIRANYHMNLIKSVQGVAPSLRVVPALLIYILIPLAVMNFAVVPSNSVGSSIIRGAFLGFCMYALYDLTNYASFNAWTLEMTMVDVAWGTFLCALGAGFGYYMRNKVFRRKMSMFNLSWLGNFKYKYPQKAFEIN
jgi:uncharacterized membrane protein